MEESASKPSLEERLKETLDKVDEFSKSASQAVKKGFDKTKKKVRETSESIDTKDMMEKTKAGISTINSQFSSMAKKAEVGKKATFLLALMYTFGQRVERLFLWLLSFAPYLIPATIIFQSALWVAFLSDGTTSNAIVSEFAESIKLLIKKKIDEGVSEKNIYEYLKNQYGDWIVYEPEFNKNTFFLWTIPVFVFVIGGWVIFRKIKFFN